MPAGRLRFLMMLSLLFSGSFSAVAEESSPGDQGASVPVSYYKQVRPIFQAHCQGCHQPAKAGGEYVMTDFEQLLAGGESGSVAVESGDPEGSYLIEQITPSGGAAEMPRDKPPLSEPELELITRWVRQGAADDTPATAVQRYDKDNPPVYTRPPVITSLDYSPDGRMLAVSGFHEVFLIAADGSARVGRLVGLSERIESVRFSPDGRQLVVAGGLPGRMGEIQIWDVPRGELLLSVPTTFDTVYGASWSPDSTRIAYGGGDNSLRALDAVTGEELVFMAAHDDWVRDTVFSKDGKSIFSVSRDKTVKMTDVATQRFVGNVTTHTPGVLLGGMIKIARHPYRDELLVGGADGAPKLFRMNTKAAPASGGNPNQIREYYQLPGRLFAVGFSPDGGQCFAGSSLDGSGQLRSFETDSGKELWQLDQPESGIFALAIHPDGKQLATAGADGVIRLIDAASGEVRAVFNPVSLEDGQLEERQLEDADAPETAAEVPASDAPAAAAEAAEQTEAASVTLVAEPTSITIDRPVDKAQFLITARMPDGTEKDVTRDVDWSVEGNIGTISPSGIFLPAEDGTGRVVASLAGERAEISVEVAGMGDVYQPDFVRDVNPVLSRLGCNAGTCHGAQKGQNGFKLSLRGYDALSDVRAFTDDLASRRVNFASPDDSLMLLKPTAAVPHEGGQLMQYDEPYYNIVRDWIASGAKLGLDTPRVAGVEVFPENPVIQQIGQIQQMRVVATYTDGRTRDVTHEAFVESGNTEVVTADQGGLMTAIRRGESAVLVRYEGAYAATTITVMGDRTGFVWKQPETWGRIDELVAGKWQRMQIAPAALCSDTEFVRRVYLDVTGLPPTPEQVRAFLADSRDLLVKRTELVNQLIGSEPYVEYWTNKWADLLQVNGKFLGREGAVAFREWIRKEVLANTPYDEFAHKIITANGSNRDNPAASYYKILREPASVMENTTHLFLAVRFNCNKCHDHPFERWTQNQYYQTAAYFARLDLQPDPAAGKKTIGGTAVEDAKPLYEIVADKSEGEVMHDRTGEVTPPKFPFECDYEVPEGATRRQQLAAWITSPDNSYFARSYVNRLWGYLFGVGIIEPIDDIRAGNPATNPELLDYLTDEFIRSDFDIRHVMRLICTSRTYQLSIGTNRWNEDDRINYSHAVARRLPAEVLYDAVHLVTGSISNIPGLPPGTRAAAIPDAGIKLPDGFLSSMGRPARESACECERSNDLQLGGVISFVGGPTVGDAISNPENELTKLVADEQDNARLISEIFLRILGRPANEDEIANCQKMLEEMPRGHEQLLVRLEQVKGEAAGRQAKLQKRRDAARHEAEVDLAARLEKVGERERELDQKHAEKLAGTEQALASFDANLAVKLKDFETRWSEGNTSWEVLKPESLNASNGAKLEVQEDLSVFASGKNGKGAYEIVAETPLEAITGVRIEVIADQRLPSGGPGRAGNGNFVLSELELVAAPNSDLRHWDLVKSWSFEDESQASEWFPREGAQTDLSDGTLALSGEAPQVETELGHWHSVGPFFDGQAFDAVLGPEGQPVNLKQTFDIDGNSVGWKRRADLPDGRVHTYSPGNGSASYFYRTIKVSAPRKMVFRFGSDDGIKVWLGGEEVFSKNVNRGAAPDQDQVPVDLAAGENHLLVKIANGVGPSSLYFATDRIPAINPAVVAAAEGSAGSYAVEVIASTDRESPARIFWAAGEDPLYSGQHVTAATPLAGGDQWNTYRFDFVTHQDLKGIRFDPAGAAVKIKEIRLYRHKLPRKIAFQNAQADYSNDSYRVTRAIDGKVNENNDGWASSPNLGETRYASFETKENVDFKGGAKLRFHLDQQYLTSKHSIGRFRLSVTQQPRPVIYGIPPEIVELVQIPLERRSEQQQQQLVEFYKKTDTERKGLLTALNQAKIPREVDKELKRLQYRTMVLQKPLSEDPKLLELQRAIDLSRRQLENQRLTVAQDIAWALINNPAFLFNH